MYRQNAKPPVTARKRRVEWGVGLGVFLTVAVGAGGIFGARYYAGHGALLGTAYSDDWPSSPPTFRDLNGDGIDDLVGPHGGGALALDGRTGTVLWERKYASGYGESVVAGDFVARLHGSEVELLDVRTGQTARTVTPPWRDKPGRLEACETYVHATAIDDTSTRIDPATGAMTSGAPTAGCRALVAETRAKEPPCRHPHAICEQAPREFGYPARVLRDPATGNSVRITYKEKGTPIATATILSPNDGTAIVLAPEGNLQAADVGSGWLAVVRGSEVMAYELATKRSWSLALTTGVKTSSYDFGWLRIEKDRLYVDTSPERRGARGELVVLDLATGTRLWR